VIAVTLGSACRSPPPPPSKAVPLLLVTLDGVGSHVPPGPALEQLAETSVAFADATSPSPLTQPALASLLTGVPPFAHGVLDDGDFALAPEQETLAERLRAAGYTTVATQDSVLTDTRFGLHQGFDTVVGTGSRDPVFPDEAPAGSPVEAVVALLPTLPDRTFVWAHLGGPAWPFTPQSPEEQRARLDRDLAALSAAWSARFGAGGVVVVTADHGEPDGAMGERRHGLLLHDATLRVPLLVQGAQDLGPPGSWVTGPVSTADVAGLLLAEAGLDPGTVPVLDLASDRPVYSETLAARFLFGGRALRSLTDRRGRTVTGAWTEHCVTQDGPCTLDDPDPARWDEVRAGLPEAVPVLASLPPEVLRALALLGYVGGDPGAPEGDLDPRAAMEDVALFRRARSQLRAGFTRDASEALVLLDRAWPDAFALRVIEGQVLWQQGRLADVEAHWLAVFSQTPTATVALELGAVEAARGRWMEAGRWYAEARRLDPESRSAVAGLVRARYASGDLDLADELASRFLAANDDHGELAPVRAEILLDQQHLDSAWEEAERGLVRVPGSAWAWWARARVEWERGEADTAVADARRAVELDPYATTLRLGLARWLLELGTHTEAVRVLAPAARLLSDDAGVQELYERARRAVTEEESVDRRIERAHGPG
jgi:tetratricopeptide (TPR) repeat protein